MAGLAKDTTLKTLQPVARDQLKLRDRVLRATVAAPEQSARGNSTVLQWDMGAYAAFSVVLAGDSSSFAIDGSSDLQVWTPLDMKLVGSGSLPLPALGFYQENSAVVGTVSSTVLVGNKQTKFVRVRSVTASSSRNSSVQVTLTQTPFIPTQPTRHFGGDNAWSYSPPTGGVTGTTPVALIAAQNSYHRRVMTQLELSNGGTAGTEVLISDSAATPVVLWRGYLAAGAVQTMQFDPPLRASANAALNITLSVAGVPVYANARGLTTLA